MLKSDQRHRIMAGPLHFSHLPKTKFLMLYPFAHLYFRNITCNKTRCRGMFFYLRLRFGREIRWCGLFRGGWSVFSFCIQYGILPPTSIQAVKSAASWRERSEERRVGKESA